MAVPTHSKLLFGLHTHPKILAISQNLGLHKGIVVSIWTALIELAKSSGLDGLIKPFDAQAFSIMVDILEVDLPSIFGEFSARNMIDVSYNDDTGELVSVHLTNWLKYNPSTVQKLDENGNPVMSKFAKSRLKKRLEIEKLQNLVDRLSELGVLEKLPAHGIPTSSPLLPQKMEDAPPDIPPFPTSQVELPSTSTRKHDNVGASETLYNHYCNRNKTGTKGRAIANLNKLLKTYSQASIMKAIDNYTDDRISKKRLSVEYMKDPANFFVLEFFKDFLPENYKKLPDSSNPFDIDPSTGKAIKPTDWLNLLTEDERNEFEMETYDRLLESDYDRKRGYDYLNRQTEYGDFNLSDKFKHWERLDGLSAVVSDGV